MQPAHTEPEEGPPGRARGSRRVLLLLALGLLAGVLARCYRVDAPLFEYRHLRPMDTAALARNFHEGRMNVLYPQVDWRGNSSGYAEAEFQAYAFSVATLYGLFGVHEWVGRAFNIGVYVLSALILFALVRRVFDELAALFAVGVYTVVPLSLYFTRTFQADALIALGVLASIWLLWLWTEDPRRWWAWLGSAAGVALATLIKPPSLYVGLPLVILCQRRFGWRFLRRPELWVYAALCIVPAVLWYRWALGLWEVHGNTFGVLGKHTVLEFWGLLDPQWLELGRRLAERVATRHATPAGLALLALGLFLAVRERRGALLGWWALAFVVYLVLVPRGNFGHDYYQLQLVFMVAAFMGLGAAWLWRKGLAGRAGLVLLAVAMLYGSATQLRGMMRPRQYLIARQAFAERVAALTDPDALVVFAVVREFEPPAPEDYRHRTAEGEMLFSDPKDMYLSNRKGFSIDDVQATPEFVDELARRGARYFATAEAYGPVRPSGGPGVLERRPELKQALDARHRALEVNDRWAIYELVDPREREGLPR